MNPVIVTGAFDDLRARHFRFLDEASRRGPLQVVLWSDAALAAAGQPTPKFTQAERLYLLQALRCVAQVTVCDQLPTAEALPELPGWRPAAWMMTEAEATPARRAWCRAHELDCQVIPDATLAEFAPPSLDIRPARPGKKKVVVTGCYDWFHSGHVRFCEEVAELGELYVVVGSDANVRLLKGEGHPLFPEHERRYIVSTIRHVHQCLISTGTGWMDAEPEFQRIGADIYAVNEDGDKPEKQEFCRRTGIQYAVLKRTPKDGLPRRSSTHLRGF